MSDLLAFARLGVGHILDPAALDHVLFLVALAAVYRPRDWRDALLVVSAFTVGHSLTLGLAVVDAVALDARLVEFLIPVTIVATAAENVSGRARRWRPALAGAFGLVHGAGFAGYLKSLFLTDVAVPLLGFNLGIEAGQIVVLAAVAAALAGVDALLRRATAAPAFRVRVVALSAAIGVVATAWAVERRPW